MTLTIREVAERWRVTPETVRGLAVGGKVPYIRVGASYRFREADIEAYEDANYHPATEALA